MPANLELLRSRTGARLRTMERHVADLPAGRGEEWKALLQHVLAEVKRDFDVTDADILRSETQEPGVAEEIRVAATVHLERLQTLLNQLHVQMATYRAAVARADVPVGLQHLIDVLIEDIVIERGDPIIHLDTRNTYSTIDLANLLNSLIAGLAPPVTPYSGDHPIAFHLPALDPNNVLLSPVLAHEVAHTAVNQRLFNELMQRLRTVQAYDDISNAFDTVAGTYDVDSKRELGKSLRAWSSELLCDAIAIALSGPSFLLAFTAFATPSISFPAGRTHPETHDRIRYALRLADELGWTEFMNDRAPKIMSWLREISEEPVLSGSADETFLRKAMDLSEDSRREVALSHITHRFQAPDQESRLDHAAKWLQQGVPLIDINNEALSPWEAILAGWLAAIRTHGDDAKTIAVAAGDEEFNSVIVKALEYSQIVSAWRAA